MNNPRRIQRHLVKALAAGALLAAAALPMAIATAAGAVTNPFTTVSFSPGGSTSGVGYFGQGASGTVTVTAPSGTFAANGGTVTFTSTAPGLTFSGGAESASTTATASFASTSATVPGTYNLTVTDANGASTQTGAFTVNAAPAATSLSPSGAVDSTTPPVTDVTVTGTGFVTGAKVTLISTVDGTKLASEATSAFTNGVVTTPANQGSSAFVSSTSLTVYVSSSNSVTGGPATPGTYNVMVTNPDGGTSTASALFTITGIAVNNVSPSAAPAPSSGTTDVAVTISGGGFQPGATVAVSGTGVTVIGTPVTASASSITATFGVASGAGTAEHSVTITNPSVAAGGNAASFTLTGGFAVGEASSVAPAVTATSETAAIVPGSPSSVLTLTGAGFSQYSTIQATDSDNNAPAPGVTLSNTGGNAGTTASFNITVGSGSYAGADSVVVSGSAAFPAAFSVAGPAITSQSPAGIADGAPAGTVITLTGTGFTNTTTGTVTNNGDGFTGTAYYSSATTFTVVELSPAAGTPTAANEPTVTLSQVNANGDTVLSTPFTLTVDAAPTLDTTSPYSITYATGTHDVGVGAVSVPVTINGTGFQSGATVGSFKNGSGVADPDVTATVTTVTATAIKATISIAAGDTNISDSFTVTNPDGGAVSTTTAGAYPLVIGAGPTITGVTPTTGAPSATTSFAVAGTGFAAGAVASLSPTNGTCGTTTVSASTTLAVTCTLGVDGVTATYLVVTNPDGGSAKSSTAVLPAAVAPVAKFHVSGVHGAAVAGKTVTITISGTGFTGQPKITAAGYKFGVSKDNGKVLTVRVTAKAGLHGEHTLTVIDAGHSGKAGFNTKA